MYFHHLVHMALKMQTEPKIDTRAGAKVLSLICFTLILRYNHTQSNVILNLKQDGYIDTSTNFYFLLRVVIFRLVLMNIDLL